MWFFKMHAYNLAIPYWNTWRRNNIQDLFKIIWDRMEMWGDIGITKEKKKPCVYSHAGDGYMGIHYTILFLCMFDIFIIKMIDP